jgi:hypothetical protein
LPIPPSLSHAKRIALKVGIMELGDWRLDTMYPTADNVVWYRLRELDAQYDTVAASRFVAVKRGTVLIAFPWAAPTIPLGLDTAVLPIGIGADVRVAGEVTRHSTLNLFDALPTGGPAGAHGILLSDGAIWLPTDGTLPYFSSGK